MTYRENDTILYSTQGVCKITEISEQNLGGSRQEYYVLKPVYSQNSTIFVPVGSEKLTAKMRRVLSVDEIHTLIQAMPQQDTIWEEDESARRERYRAILLKGDRLELVRLIKTLQQRQESKKAAGKKLHSADEQTLKDAEKMLHEEFAHVLNLSREQVPPFIQDHIRGAAKQKASKQQKPGA